MRAVPMKMLGYLSFTFLAVGCHSPGPYGHATEYAPLDAEEAAAENAVDFDPVMALRDRKTWSSKLVSAFGVVEERAELKNGKTKLVLSLRTLSPRNLCDEGGEDTCRVTVSAKGYGEFTAIAKLSEEDDAGRDSLKAGSLVRVVGHLRYDDATEGSAPTLEAIFYRHFPFRQFVTTAARSYLMR